MNPPTPAPAEQRAIEVSLDDADRFVALHGSRSVMFLRSLRWATPRSMEDAGIQRAERLADELEAAGLNRLFDAPVSRRLWFAL